MTNARLTAILALLALTACDASPTSFDATPAPGPCRELMLKATGSAVAIICPWPGMTIERSAPHTGSRGSDPGNWVVCRCPEVKP